MNYLHKYLKYKSKYLAKKKEYYDSSMSDNNISCTGCNCNSDTNSNITIDPIYKYNNVSSFISDYEDGKIHFPVKRIYKSNKDIQDMFDKLKKINIYDKKQNRILLNEKYTVRNLNMDTNELVFKDTPYLILHNDSDYEDFNTLTDMFLEDLRMECEVYGSNTTPMTYFSKNYKQLAHEIYNKHKNITPYLLRETLWSKKKDIAECTAFKSINMMSIVQILYPEYKKIKDFSVLDPSSGWGDRLLAAMALDISYTGVDPNSKLHPRYKQMIDFFIKDTNTKNKYTLTKPKI